MGDCVSKPRCIADGAGRRIQVTDKHVNKAVCSATDWSLELVDALVGASGILAEAAGPLAILPGLLAAHLYREYRGIPHPPTEDEQHAMRIHELIADGDMKRLRAICSLSPGACDFVHLRHPKTGGTALHAAALHNRPECMPLLLRAGALVDSPTRVEKRTPLMLAAMHGKIEVLRALLAARAQVGLVDDRWYTALHHAAASGSTDCVAALLEAGADASARRGDRKSAGEVAAEGKHETCVCLLRQALGRPDYMAVAATL